MASKKHAGGRPLKFKSVKQLQSQIDAYFSRCDPHWIDEEYYDYPIKKSEDGTKYRDTLAKKRKMKRKVKSLQIPYTITGLALALGTTRETLLDYESGKHDAKDGTLTDLQLKENDLLDKFSDTIKAAKLKCELYAEQQLYIGKATGPIFSLKNNYGWTDKTENDINLNTGVTLSAKQSEQLIRARAKRSDS